MLSHLTCLGRHTITGLLCTSGFQFEDWTADYRIYSEERFNPHGIFNVIRKKVSSAYPIDVPFIVAMDDSLLPRHGMKIPGVAYRRDPLGPPFVTNFIKPIAITMG